MLIKRQPHPKQILALERNEYEILYGGARGGGKTDAGMAFLLYDTANPKYRALVIRRNAVDLTDWIDRAREFYRGFKVEVVGGNEIRFPSGAIIRLGHLKDDNAYNRYQGHEYQKILIEELTHIPNEDLYLKLISSCRSTVPGIQAQVFCTTNPGEIGHARVKRRFIDVALPGKVYHDPISDRSRIFIPSRIEDNPTLMTNDPTYIKFLEALPPDLMKAWREGSRDVFDTKGSYYSAYIMQARKENRICKGLREPGLPIYKIRDLGIDDEMVIICAQFMGKEIRIIDCLYGNNEGLAYYIDLLREKGYGIDNCYYPHDVRVREQSSGGKTREDYLKSLGVDVHIVSKIDIVDGVSQVRMVFNKIWFEDNPGVQKLIEALNIYRKKRDEKNLVFGQPIHDWSSNFCLVGDTKIETINGSKCIKDIVIGDLVLTPKGYKRVYDSKKTGFEYLFKVKGLIGTGAHKVYTNRGLKRIDTLEYSDILYGFTFIDKIKWKQLYLMEKITDYLNEGNIIEESEIQYKHFIEWFGNFIIEKDQNDLIFTIRMKIQRIIIYLIWNLGKHINIGQNTIKKDGKMNILDEDILNELKMHENEQLYGISQKNEGNGIKNKLSTGKVSSLVQRLKGIVNIVIKKYISFDNLKRFIVQYCVNKDIVEKVKWIILRVLVLFVVINSHIINMLKLSRVVKNVQPQKLGLKDDVYNISVEDEHCYYANGILVSNCDALRYLAIAYGEIVAVKSTDFRRNTQRTITNPITGQIMNKVDPRKEFLSRMGIKI